MSELQNLAAFLMAPGQCDWLTGQSIMMDGGSALATGGNFYELRNWSDDDWRVPRTHRGAEPKDRAAVNSCVDCSRCWPRAVPASAWHVVMDRREQRRPRQRRADPRLERRTRPALGRVPARLDRMIEPFGNAALQAAARSRARQVLDIGCGCGSTSLALARAVGPQGRVLGVDISRPMLAAARRLAATHAALPLSFIEADAPCARCPARRICCSRASA